MIFVEVFISNLPHKLDYHDLKDFCMKYGELEGIGKDRSDV